MSISRNTFQQPMSAFLAVITLAIGLGFVSALSSFLDRLLFNPVPYPEASRLVSIWGTLPNDRCCQFNGFQFQALTKAEGLFEGIAAIGVSTETADLPNGPIMVDCTRITGNLFSILHMQPQLGRLGFIHDEEVVHGSGAMIISYRFWKDSFFSDPNIIGKRVRISGRYCQVIGVLPKGFNGLSARQSGIKIFLPITFSPEDLGPNAGVNYEVIGRLGVGVSLLQAETTLKGIVAMQNEPRRSIRLAPLAEDLVAPFRERLALLSGAVALLLLLATVNSSALLLSRQESRLGNIALKAVLGASPLRLAWEATFDGFGLGILGAFLGLAIDSPFRYLLCSYVGLSDVPSRPNWVFGIIPVLGIISGAFASILPAVVAFGARPVKALQDLNQATTSRGRIRFLMVCFELSISFMLFAEASLLLRSLWSQLNIGIGVSSKDLYVCDLSSPLKQQQNVLVLAQGLTKSISTIPGVMAVSFCLPTPLYNPGGDGPVQAEDKGIEAHAWCHQVSGPISATFGVKILCGRDLYFDDPDSIIISQQLARKLWPGGNAIGRRVDVFDGYKTVVGVVEGSREYSIYDPLRPQVFLQIWNGYKSPRLTLLLRSHNDIKTLHTQIESAVQAVSPSMAIGDLRTFEDILMESTNRERQSANLMALQAVVAGVLSSIGLLGLLSQFLRRRARELAIRAALGARPSMLVSHIAMQCGGLYLVSLAIGLIGTVSLGSLIQGFFPNTARFDIVSIVVAALILAISVVASGFIPALRAALVQPSVTLKEQ